MIYRKKAKQNDIWRKTFEKSGVFDKKKKWYLKLWSAVMFYEQMAKTSKWSRIHFNINKPSLQPWKSPWSRGCLIFTIGLIILVGGYHAVYPWGRMTHICVSNLIIIASDNGLSPGRRQAIIWTNAGISLIGPLGTNFSENFIEIITFSLKEMRLKVLSKWRPFCLGLNVLNKVGGIYHNIRYIIVRTTAEHKSDIDLTKHTPWLTLMSEPWGVWSDDYGENWSMIIMASHCIWLTLGQKASWCSWHLIIMMTSWFFHGINNEMDDTRITFGT